MATLYFYIVGDGITVPIFNNAPSFQEVEALGKYFTADFLTIDDFKEYGEFTASNTWTANSLEDAVDMARKGKNLISKDGYPIYMALAATDKIGTGITKPSDTARFYGIFTGGTGQPLKCSTFGNYTTIIYPYGYNRYGDILFTEYLLDPSTLTTSTGWSRTTTIGANEAEASEFFNISYTGYLEAISMTLNNSDPVSIEKGSSIYLEFTVIGTDFENDSYTDVTITSASGDELPESEIIIAQNGIAIPDTVTTRQFNLIATSNTYQDSEGNPLTTSFTVIVSNIVNPDPYGQGGNSSQSGGNGSYNDGSSDDSDNTVPEESAESNYSNTGLFTIYAMNTSELQALGNKLYTTEWAERLEMEVMKLFWNSPIEAAISLQSFPFGLPAGATATDIKFGSLVLEGISGSVVGNSAMSVNWGTVKLEEYWGNFLDYAPHTKIDLYLPWGAGFVPLDPHECLPGTIGIQTNIELSKGTCVHIVSGKYGVIGCYGGKCSSELPLTALDTGAKMLTTTVAVAAGGAAILAAGAGAIGAGLAAASAPLVSGAAAAVAPAVTQGAAGATLSTLAAGASSGYSTVAPAVRASRLPTAMAAALNPPHIQKSGSFYSSGAGLGPQKPFLIISRPEQNVPANYGHQYGYPSNITSGLHRGLGYTEVGAIHLQGIRATEYELAEIEKFLEAGVIL